MTDTHTLLTAIQSDTLKVAAVEIDKIIRAAIAPLYEQVTPITAEMKPVAVKLKQASMMLGGKSISEIYEAAGRGELDLVKDGNSTLVVVASIERYVASLPKAKVRQYPPKKPSAVVSPTAARIAKHSLR